VARGSWIALPVERAAFEIRAREPNRAVVRRSVMRAAPWARWATCALAISICVPALADRAPRSLATCTSFDQVDQGDDKVAFTIHNTCSIPIDCTVSWRLVCAPESTKRRSSHPDTARLAVSDGTSQTAEASASVCGNQGWVIDSVRWRCSAAKD